MTKVLEFSGYYRFLSNFWACPVEFEHMMFASSEHAYQAAKTLDMNQRRLIQGCPASGNAKRAGKLITLRPDWDKLKTPVMYDIVHDKFTRNLDLRHRLIATGKAELEEGNYWGDHFWGICPAGSGDGKNYLGKILMDIRQEFQP